MTEKKKIITIGQLKYRKRQEDSVMKEIIDITKSEGIHLSKEQLLQL